MLCETSFKQPVGSSSRQFTLEAFITFLLLTLSVGHLLAQRTSDAAVSPPKLDQYGGLKDIPFTATGFFRIEKTADRYWLVTPDGNAFLTHGINHVVPKWMKQFYNVDFWARKYGINDYSDKAFHTAFRQKVEEDIQAVGWNTLGCHSLTEPYERSFIPYVKTVRFVNIHHYQPHDARDFPDVFSEAFVQYTDSLARAIVLPLKDDRYLLGYFMTDCPILTETDAAAHGNNIYGKTRPASPTWPNVIRNLPAASPGKQAYVQHVEAVYSNDISAFNTTYETRFANFKELLGQTDWRTTTDRQNEREQRDNHGFLLKILDRRYAVETAAIKKYDSHHLILGDKFNGNTDTPADILAVAARYSDVIFIQHYAFWDELEPYLNKVAKATQKPIIQGDASVHVPYESMPNPYGPHCANQQERIEKVRELYLNAFARPDFLGWHWCGWMDSWEVGGQVGKQHGGLQDPFGNFHPVKDFLTDFSKNMYSVAQEPSSTTK